MDPVTLSILAGVGATAASQLPQLIPTSFDREQKKRLAELQRKEELGMLGLTDQERRVLENRAGGAMRQAEQSAAVKRQQYLAGGGGATGGQSLLQSQLADEQKRMAQERINTEIEAQDLAKQQRQMEELRALEAARGERKAQAVAAGGAILGAGIEAGVTTSAQERLFAGAKAPSANSVQALATTMGISPDEARGFIELGATNPEMFKYLSLISSNGVK
jgi:hypothetical protein